MLPAPYSVEHTNAPYCGGLLVLRPESRDGLGEGDEAVMSEAGAMAE